ncbi:hypothetical protein HTH_0398 [Hydrogenobacter thermophilus TK-6]|uniref:Uncharacterized protein n=1 Tax=Hydrogenobacter thermophilus (strain DSM 6534 / IAM 12695 / TK-6) TaxID=608538 RepID=D3DGB0_HYDTT|nr:hypothetical protein HTH_0398 [Hydrogenobacter thermophilus TK-6]
MFSLPSKSYTPSISLIPRIKRSLSSLVEKYSLALPSLTDMYSIICLQFIEKLLSFC